MTIAFAVWAVMGVARHPSAHIDLPASAPGWPLENQRVVVLGASGYIGRAVVAEALLRGYRVAAVVRDATSATAYQHLKGASIVSADVCDPASLATGVFMPGDVVVSCLASRSGFPKDSWRIDYQATLDCLEV